MKRVCLYLALLLILSPAITAYAGEGNGAPSGPHYNLNVIGVQKEKSADMDDNNGHRIFVKLQGKTKIMLGEGEYKVLDANGTDGSAAFQLPSPDPDNDGLTTYSVYVRALGKPNGAADMTTCAQDPETGDEVCSMYILEMRTRDHGNNFKDVSRYLLYIYADLVDDGYGVPERYPLFDDRLEEYFWSYDNNGLKIAQFRFYEMPTEEPDPGPFEQP